MTGINVTFKKEKRDISQVKYFYYKKKSHYANKYPKKKIRVKKLVIVLATSTPMTVARKEVIEDVEDDENLGITIRASEDNENLRSSLAWVPYI